MNELKKGDSVKAWDDDPSDYVIGKFMFTDEIGGDVMTSVFIGSMRFSEWFSNAVKIPDELAKQLEDLG